MRPAPGHPFAPPRLFRLMGMAAAVAAIVAGCGTSSSSTPTTVLQTSSAPASAAARATATVAPAASPSPTPDVSSAALRTLSRMPATGMDGDVSGTLTSSAGAWPVSGTISVVGASQQSDLQLTVGTATQASHLVVADGKAYVEQGSGPWFAAPTRAGGYGPTSGATLDSLVTSITSVKDVGLEDHAGQQLHHLTVDTSTSPAPIAFGFADGSITGADLTVDLYADDNGTPVLLAVSGGWQQRIGASVAAVTVALDVKVRPSPASVTAPAEIWSSFSSKRYLYHAAKPTDWTYTAKASADELVSPEDTGIDLASTATPENLNQAAADLVSANTHVFGRKPEHTESVTIAGSPARLLTYHVTQNKLKLYVMEAVVVYKGRAYVVSYVALAGDEASDRATFLEFLGTFGFGR